MRRAALALALVSFAVLIGYAGVTPGGALPSSDATAADVRASSDAAGTAPVAEASPPDEPETEIVIAVREDGNATWEVRTRYALRTENDSRAFERLVSELQRGEGEAARDEETFRNFAAQGAAATGRDMRILNVSYDGERRAVPDEEYEIGVLTMSFAWTNFAATPDDGVIRVGDAFRSPDRGLWFSSLSADQRLVLVTPSDYRVDESRLAARTQGDRLVVEGPRQFDRESFRVVYSRAATGGGETTASPPGDGSFDAALLAGLGVVALVTGTGVWLLYRRDKRIAPAEDGAEAAAATEDLSGVPPPEEDDGFDPSLLSDEERVEYLLERNGGRMRQADIVDETGWSDAKVSQLLSSMADADRVNKLRLGRENLISLQDRELADPDAPTDGEVSEVEGGDAPDSDGSGAGTSRRDASGEDDSDGASPPDRSP